MFVARSSHDILRSYGQNHFIEGREISFALIHPRVVKSLKLRSFHQVKVVATPNFNCEKPDIENIRSLNFTKCRTKDFPIPLR